MGNLKNIPKLRFPEFVNDGEWKERTLGQVGKFIGGGTPSTTKKEYWDGEIQWYTPTEVKGEKLSGSERKITDLGLKNSSAKLLPIGTILITTRATIGDVGITETVCTTNQGFQSLKVYDSEVNIFWFYWIIQHRNELIKRAYGSTFKEINKTEIKKISVLSPLLKSEQQKIADCLSSLDDLINAHKEKLDILKEHKKGLLQNLFPQEGEKVPKYRFPEFENDGDWEEKKLKSLGKFQGGGTPSKKKKNYWVGDIPWISSSDVYDNDIFNISITRYINEESIQNSATKLIPENSVLFVSRVGVGKFVVNETPVCTSQDFSNFTPKKINSYFVAYSFLANKNKLVALVQGTSIKGFTIKDLKKTEILVPNKLMEQQKIAETLSSLDSIIEQQQKKIEELEEHKKGLLQGLFPEIED